MGLFQKAIETYDANLSIVGKEIEGRATLPPICHSLVQANIEITIDKNGRFISARVIDKNEPKILIPVSEASGGRTGGVINKNGVENKKPKPHPLCDKYQYIDKRYDISHKAYLKQLLGWAKSEYSHPFLMPIYNYVKSTTIEKDLNSSKIVPKADDVICWILSGLGYESGACWKSNTLFFKWIEYCKSLDKDKPQELCSLTGDIQVITTNHPKNIVSKFGNAKLISFEEKEMIKYSGRFTGKEQAATIGYYSSQKAHNALRWVSANQGVSINTQNKGKSGYDAQFVCWNPKGNEVRSPLYAFLDFDSDIVCNTLTDYRKRLAQTLLGYRSKLPDNSGGVVIAVFDSPAKGRLSVTYYNELQESDFLQRLANWDEHCCWWNGPYGICSPSLFDITKFAFGNQKIEKNQYFVDIPENIVRPQMQRLLHCRVDQKQFPLDLEIKLVRKASNLAVWDDTKDSSFLRRKLLFTACAVIRKYHYDLNKEDYVMYVEPDKHDISYQFGRLLAFLEKAERDTYDQDEKREPNAIRRQSVFCQKPWHTFTELMEILRKAYYPKLTPTARTMYEIGIENIVTQINQFPIEEHNRPLKDTYLLGYYLQKKDLYTASKKENKNVNTAE